MHAHARISTPLCMFLFFQFPSTVRSSTVSWLWHTLSSHSYWNVSRARLPLCFAAHRWRHVTEHHPRAWPEWDLIVLWGMRRGAQCTLPAQMHWVWLCWGCIRRQHIVLSVLVKIVLHSATGSLLISWAHFSPLSFLCMQAQSNTHIAWAFISHIWKFPVSPPAPQSQIDSSSRKRRDCKFFAQQLSPSTLPSPPPDSKSAFFFYWSLFFIFFSIHQKEQGLEGCAWTGLRSWEVRIFSSPESHFHLIGAPCYMVMVVIIITISFFPHPFLSDLLLNDSNRSTGSGNGVIPIWWQQRSWHHHSKTHNLPNHHSVFIFRVRRGGGRSQREREHRERGRGCYRKRLDLTQVI